MIFELSYTGYDFFRHMSNHALHGKAQTAIGINKKDSGGAKKRRNARICRS